MKINVILLLSSFLLASNAFAYHHHFHKEKLEHLSHHRLVELALLQYEQNKCLKEELEKAKHKLHEEHRFHALEKALVHFFIG